jgi:uncharacterized protein (DUF433 family)
MNRAGKRAVAKKNAQEHTPSQYQVRELGQYIVAHQGICHGQPTFKGTRVLVHVVLESLERPGRTVEQVAADYRLPVEAVVEALQWAATLVRDQLRLPDPHPDNDPVQRHGRWSVVMREHEASCLR